MAQSKEFPQYRWIPPRSYTRGRIRDDYPDVIVIHTTEGSENSQSAEDGALYNQRRTDGTSAHFFVDQNSIVQGVLTTDEAHTARRNGNDRGIHIEVCGRAGQTAAQWNDAASAGTINQCIKLCVELRRKYGKTRFPLKNLTPAQLREGKNGFAEHYDFTRAYPEDKGTHTDPGPNFPWAKLFAGIIAAENPPKGDTMQWDDKVQNAAGTGDTGPNNNRTFRQLFADLWNAGREWWYAPDNGSGDTALVTRPGPNSRQVKHFLRVHDMHGEMFPAGPSQASRFDAIEISLGHIRQQLQTLLDQHEESEPS